MTCEHSDCNWDSLGKMSQGVSMDTAEYPSSRRHSHDGANMVTDPEAAELCGSVHAVLPFRLSFAVHESLAHTRQCIEENPALHYFSSPRQNPVDDAQNSAGAMNLATAVQFCADVRKRLEDPRIAHRHLVYYCYAHNQLLSNAIFLLGAYLILEEGWSAERATERFSSFHAILSKASNLSLFDHLSALQNAVCAGFLKLDDFDLHEYGFLAQKRMHFICPKFAALSDPECALDEYLQIFKCYDVSAVVRLNGTDTYEKQEIEAQGIRHYDLYFEDGTAPPLRVVDRFLSICNEENVVAVHCIAGLGRTATLIAVWIMREYGWSALQATAWLRMVRPGSINDVQQHFLQRYENLVRNYCVNIPDPSHFLAPQMADSGPQVEVTTWQHCPVSIGSNHPVLASTADPFMNDRCK